MSRAFVKEPDGDEVVDDLPDLPVSRHPNYVTPQGLRMLERRLSALDAQRQALADHDLDMSERLLLHRLSKESKWLKHRLESAVVIDNSGKVADEIEFGAIVRLEDEHGAVSEFQIVGEDEADPEHGKVSWVSPLARAVRNARRGDLVTWRRPVGNVELEVVDIRYPGPEAPTDAASFPDS